MHNPPQIILDDVHIERFWQKVDRRGDDECWLWKASKTRQGYGQVVHFYPHGKPTHFGAHRVSWVIAHGQIPEGMFVCHNCPQGDNPSCVNPAHLFLGTPKDNIADCKRKGRLGLRRSVLTVDDVRDIRLIASQGGDLEELACKYGVRRDTIQRVVKRQSWRNVD